MKVPNSLIVSGLSNSELDKELFDFLRIHGPIARVIPILDTKSTFHKQTIIEYKFGSAIESIEPVLPLTRSNSEDPQITYLVRALSSVYSSHVGNDATKSYLDMLKGIAKHSGRSFSDVLQEELSQISMSLNPTSRDVDRSEDSDGEDEEHCLGKLLSDQGVEATLGNLTSQSPVAPSLSHTLGQEKSQYKDGAFCKASSVDVNLAEVQRVIVEHIVKNEGVVAQPHMFTKIRTFCGKTPCPNSETDYDTWRTNVELILEDPSMSDLHRSRKILESLLAPASDIIKPLGPQATPRAYLELLDSAFGTVEDGDELFAKFMNTLQNAGEKPSSYLHRLQSTLT